jgi:FMN phosphatase YigB (HAD superfamily)
MKTVVAFDVDGTIIDLSERPRWDVISLLIKFGQLVEVSVIVWSGGGQEYAEHWVNKLGLANYVDEVISKTNTDLSRPPDITFDDEVVSLGVVNILIPDYTENI